MKRVRGNSILPRIRLVHCCDLAGNSGPFEFTAQRLAALLTLEFLPFQEFVAVLMLAMVDQSAIPVYYARESKMGLYNHVQTPRSNVAVRARK